MNKLIVALLLIIQIYAPNCIALCSFSKLNSFNFENEDIKYLAIGKSIDKNSFDYDNLIYTNHTILITKSTSNFNAGDTISIIKSGGVLKNICQFEYGSQSITEHEISIFLLNNENGMQQHFSKTFPSFKLLNTNFAVTDVNSIKSKPKFIQQLKTKWPSIAEYNNVESENNNQKISNNSISNVYPNIIDAGKFSQIEINGTGFGTLNNQATVQFRNSDFIDEDEYISVPANHIISWTDDNIKVLVPGTNVETGIPGAGTGFVKVVLSDGIVIQSNSILTINTHSIVSDMNNVDVNSISVVGNFGFYIHQSLIDIGAQPAIERAINTWNCATGISYQIFGSTTINCSANDLFNIIALDNECPIYGLASTRTTVDQCNNDVFLLDADILINDEFNWHLDESEPLNGFYDLESTILHELAHVHQIGHVLNEEDLMYPNFNHSTVKRNIDGALLNTAKNIMAKSVLPNTCGTFPIKPINVNCNNVKPTALFTLDKQKICVGDYVDFQNLSTNNSNEWIWLLPGADYTQVTVAEPYVSYNEVGIYDVSLIASNTYGTHMLVCENCIEVVDECCVSPVNIYTSELTSTSATINWEQNDIVDDYSINIKSATAQSWTNFSSTNNFGILSGLSPCTVYEVQIISNCGNQTINENPNIFTFETIGCVNCIAPPSVFVLNVNQNSAFVNWDIVPIADRYVFEYRKAGQTQWQSYETKFPAIILFGLPECTVFEYKVNSVCSEYETSINGIMDTFQTGCEKNNFINSENLFSIYPNPTTDFIHLSSNYKLENVTANIYNSLGQKVITTKGNSLKTISINTLKSGSYFIQLITDNKTQTLSFVKN